MRKTILSCVATVMVLAACNNKASNKEAAASNPAAKEAVTLDTSKAAPVPATTPEPAPATTATAAWEGVKEISDAAFADKVLNNPGLTVVDFNATWCGPCKMLKPIFDKAAKDFSGKASFASMDVDENPAVSEKYKIQSIPLLLFFKGGKVVNSIVGLVSAKEIYTAIEKNM